MQDKQIELVRGCGVFLTQRQLDAAVSGAGGSPTYLMRNLIGTFFTPEILTYSHNYNLTIHNALIPHNIMGKSVVIILCTTRVAITLV